ncbi:TrkH family potassium uptake protein [Thermodesulfobacterium hydrogeniphilum]|uniref:TrkH family potassium uptake protein n=1 Tax=Thermodesulfobacterium hydrogeniphilum TaxID=161156 RepID=UPI00057165E2|nr:TrkH family potassium uptake protein [Thermodesulfobacterium hydrogeniphilum]
MRLLELTPHRIILISYLILILIGAILLYLPFSVNKPIHFLDAIFTATSAVTVTGLIVLNTAKDFTFLGKLIILFLIQIGGLGYLTFTTYFLITLKRKIGLRERLILAESLNISEIYGLVKFLKKVFPIIILIEFIGTILLFFPFLFKFKDFNFAFFAAFFHSISAFNNAGFSIFPDNFIQFRNNFFINFIIALLIILGGLGFYVLDELLLYIKKEIKMLSIHTKLVLLSSIIFIFLGALILFINVFNWSDLTFKEKFLISFFHSISARTAGFNTIDLSRFSEGSLFSLICLMFIGASPGGTGGGIKTITMVVILLSVYSYIRGYKEVVVFNRSIKDNQIHRAMIILSLGFFYTTFMALLLSELEEKPFLATLFEVISAFSTVGLSIGNSQGLSFCADFSNIGKLLIILTMIVGRVGILSFMLAIAGKEKIRYIKHPEARLYL